MTFFEKLRLIRELLAFGDELFTRVIEIGRAFHERREEDAVRLAHIRANEQASGRAANTTSKAVKGSYQ